MFTDYRVFLGFDFFGFCLMDLWFVIADMCFGRRTRSISSVSNRIYDQIQKSSTSLDLSPTPPNQSSPSNFPDLGGDLKLVLNDLVLIFFQVLGCLTNRSLRSQFLSVIMYNFSTNLKGLLLCSLGLVYFFSNLDSSYGSIFLGWCLCFNVCSTRWRCYEDMEQAWHLFRFISRTKSTSNMHNSNSNFGNRDNINSFIKIP